MNIVWTKQSKYLKTSNQDVYASTYEYLASRKRHKLSEFDNCESMILTLQDFAFTHIWTFKSVLCGLT